MSSGASPPFATTRWTMVAAAGKDSSPESHQALAELCACYWYPLYAYVRRRGLRAEEAQDATQSFFSELLEKARLQLADPQRGRFRSFLLASMNNFLSNQWRQAAAIKRGGAVKQLSLDFEQGERQYSREPVHELTPEKVFERRWAVTLLDHTLSRLQQEYVSSGKAALFDGLKAHLGGDDAKVPYDEMAKRLNTSEGAIKVAAHRFRKRYRELLREEIAQTVSSDEDVEDELRALFEAVASD